MYVCIKVSNSCKNTCHFAFLPLNGSCALFPHNLQATSSPAQNIIMSFAVPTGRLFLPTHTTPAHFPATIPYSGGGGKVTDWYSRGFAC